MRFVVTRWLKRIGLGVLVGLLLLWLTMLATSSPLPGLKLAGVALGDGNAERRITERFNAWQEDKVVIHTGPYVARATRKELGAVRDPAEALAKLSAIGRTGNPLVDVPAFFGALSGSQNVQWPIKVDQHKLLEFVRKLRRRMERPPIAGTTTRDGQPIDGIPGLTINSMLAVSALKDALQHDSPEANVATQQIPPPVPVSFEALNASAQFGIQLATFRSEYARRGGDSGRAINIEIAGAKLDGVVIAPGDQLSFNEVVGERSLARGFQVAPEISNQLIVQGVGGGVCQTAATLHAAAFLAGFDVLEYKPHSRPTRYVPTGLDTMVWWPDKDLKVRNPYPFPVRISVALDPSGAITVSLYGAGQPHPVDWDTEILSTTPAGEKRVQDDTLAMGQTQVKQSAVDGMVIKRTRTVYFPHGPKVEERELRYPPTPKITAYGGI